MVVRREPPAWTPVLELGKKLSRSVASALKYAEFGGAGIKPEVGRRLPVRIDVRPVLLLAVVASVVVVTKEDMDVTAPVAADGTGIVLFVVVVEVARELPRFLAFFECVPISKSKMGSGCWWLFRDGSVRGGGKARDGMVSVYEVDG